MESRFDQFLARVCVEMIERQGLGEYLPADIEFWPEHGVFKLRDYDTVTWCVSFRDVMRFAMTEWYEEAEK